MEITVGFGDLFKNEIERSDCGGKTESDDERGANGERDVLQMGSQLGQVEAADAESGQDEADAQLYSRIASFSDKSAEGRREQECRRGCQENKADEMGADSCKQEGRSTAVFEFISSCLTYLSLQVGRVGHVSEPGTREYEQRRHTQQQQARFRDQSEVEPPRNLETAKVATDLELSIQV